MTIEDLRDAMIAAHPEAEAELERRLDFRLTRALQTYPAYIHAENADEQAIAEDELAEAIEAQEIRKLAKSYGVTLP